ncbi:hypothetical protein MVEN_02136100 [Mycena venus]|uniref:MARVEL domain-containing protein n=1 Tax=Mycena venus TaxID=2733690 RepID=A0A8H6XAK3_9AGAR|nr:hypothetical protein MVEN_02136100 [Mycena venus]
MQWDAMGPFRRHNVRFSAALAVKSSRTAVRSARDAPGATISLFAVLSSRLFEMGAATSTRQRLSRIARLGGLMPPTRSRSLRLSVLGGEPMGVSTYNACFSDTFTAADKGVRKYFIRVSMVLRIHDNFRRPVSARVSDRGSDLLRQPYLSSQLKARSRRAVELLPCIWHAIVVIYPPGHRTQAMQRVDRIFIHRKSKVAFKIGSEVERPFRSLTFAFFPSMAPVPSNPDEASNLTSGLTSILACMIPVLAFAYIAAILWTLDYGNRRKTPLNKMTSLASHRYAPVAYAFIVISSLVVIAIPSWILLQYSLQQNYPNAEARIGMQLVLFTACWTCITAATFTILFVHPKWTRHPISSIGTQSIWVLLTWTLWLASAAVLNHAMPQLFNNDTCQRLVYCGHIRAVFAFSALEIVVFTAGMAIMMWLAWRCARGVWSPAPIRTESA